MRVVGLDHLVLNVKDIDKSLQFYRDVLGLEVLREDQFRRGEVGFVSVRVSESSLIDLRSSDGETGGSRNLDHFCLVVDEHDMEGLIEALQSQGVDARGPAGVRWGARGNGPSFHVTDPDGNQIEIKSYVAG